MSEKKKIEFPTVQVAEFCKNNRIRKLSLFGSALREDFRPDSDIDLLVEFQTGAATSLIDLARMERELSGRARWAQGRLGAPPTSSAATLATRLFPRQAFNM